MKYCRQIRLRISQRSLGQDMPGRCDVRSLSVVLLPGTSQASNSSRFVTTSQELLRFRETGNSNSYQKSAKLVAKN